jgi:riboflavin kinase/FMN adenylyltransferase
MHVARSLNDVTRNGESVVTVGTFDGVHLGHRSIIDELTRHAQANAGRSIVITFEPHPREVVGRGPVKLLTTPEERLRLLSDLGVDITLILEFTYEFSRLSSREFYQHFVVNGVGASDVVLGYDHMFGRNREAGIQEVIQMGKEYGFRAHSVPPTKIDGETVSSTVIRSQLLAGDVQRAAQLLGRPYSMEGRVVRGSGRGAELGFPTANIQPTFEKKLVPADGVYVVSAKVGGTTRYGMTNIGHRPTFGEGERTIEVHTFDFDGNLYGEVLELHFLRRLRAEQRFESQTELVEQLRRDREESLKFIHAVQSLT